MWTPEYLSIHGNVRKMLMADIESEKAAINQYKMHMKMIKDNYINAVLTRIIRDEEYHIMMLQALLKDLQQNPKVSFARKIFPLTRNREFYLLKSCIRFLQSYLYLELSCIWYSIESNHIPITFINNNDLPSKLVSYKIEVVEIGMCSFAQKKD